MTALPGDLAGYLGPLGPRGERGIAATEIPGLRVFWAQVPVPATPVVYDAGLVIIAQGHKVGHLGGRSFRYDPATYLVVSVPMPIECETVASPEAPLLRLFLEIDLGALADLVAALDAPARAGVGAPRGVEPAAFDPGMAEAAGRLARALTRPAEARALGSALARDVLFRALLGEQGAALMALARAEAGPARLARAIARMHVEFAAPFAVAAIAEEAGLSVSAFHRAFKAVTSETPLQYVKKLRLDRARSLLVHQNLTPSRAAYEVGYESPSQFSRDFKRHFQVPPSEARSTPRLV